MESVFQPRRREIEERIKKLAVERNYPLDVTTAQRTLGPRENVSAPPHGTEIFVSKIPREIFEDKLLPLFETAGNIYRFRLMMSPSGISNRGTAFVTYSSSEMAMGAIEMFNQMEIAPGHCIEVRQSLDNRRLFIGGIPEHKTKDQVWHELTRIGMRGILDVIMYRSYIDRNRNRGFVFVEFSAHEEASRVRLEFKDTFIFENRVQIDWSAPVNNVDDATMKRVTKLFFRNLNVLQEPAEFAHVIIDALGSQMTLEKVYKYRDYAFVHFVSRRDAQRALSVLQEYFKYTNVEVCWAKPVLTKKKKLPDTSPSSSASSSPDKSNAEPMPIGRYNPSTPSPLSHPLNATNGLMPNPNATYCQRCLAYISNDWVESTRRIFESLNL